MKAIYVLICLFLFHQMAFGQDSIRRNTEKKTQFSLLVGGYYKFFLGKRYIDPTPSNSGEKFQDHQYDRFTQYPAWGYKVGFLLSYKIKKRWYLITGLVFCNRKIIYENNQDTVIKYGNSSSIRDIDNLIKYEYSYNNIELPFILSYKIKRLNLYAGVYIPALTFYNATYTYVINQYPQDPSWGTSQKTIKCVEIPLMIFPTLQISYNFKIKRLLFSPYLGIDFGSKKSVYFQSGIIFRNCN